MVLSSGQTDEIYVYIRGIKRQDAKMCTKSSVTDKMGLVGQWNGHPCEMPLCSITQNRL